MRQAHKPPSLGELFRRVGGEDVNPRKLYFSFCQRSGQGRFTRKLRPKAQIRKERKRQRAARRAARR